MYAAAVPLYKFTFFWDSESFIHFFSAAAAAALSFYTLTAKYISNTAYTRNKTPRKMLFYSAHSTEQYKF